MSVFVIDQGYLLIHEGEPPPPIEGPLFDEHGQPPARDHFALFVSDIDDHCAALRAKGLELEPRDFPWGRSAYILDPDGRLVELEQGP